MRQFRFSPALPENPTFTVGDAAILLAITTILYAGARLAFRAPAIIAGPDISLSPLALPWYALLSVGRMAAAYFLSLLFSLFYGYAAARNRTARTVLMPLLDVLQSVPILSFFPVVFLMAAEIFNVGSRDFRLPGLGSYLQTAASQGDSHAVVLGVITLVGVIVLLDQLVWRPLIAWTDRFKMDMVEGDEPPRSWFLDLLSRAWLVEQFGTRIWRPFSEWVDRGFQRRASGIITSPEPSAEAGHSRMAMGILTAFLLVALYGSYRAAALLVTLPGSAWAELGKGIVATFLRVNIALAITLIWTIPAGVFIGTNRRLVTVLQPIVQVVASIPATALFPVVLLALLQVPGGFNIAAVLLMLMGTQWYLLFNVIAGASAIPQDLRYTTDLLRLSSLDRWRTLILPALFPYIITGAITASGGAWNASIVAEHVEFGGQTHATIGVGAQIAQATASGDYALLLAATLALVITVVFVNRIFWRRLYRLAEERYRME